jgi:lipopolysaccharide transport system ATP-binding protein
MKNNLLMSLSNVGLKYDVKTGGFGVKEYWALKDISLKLYHGECLGVIGRNGVGKSSLLKILAGILAPDIGSVDKSEDFNTSLLSLQLGFSANLTGRENAMLSGMLLGLSSESIREKLPDVAAFAELDDFFDAPLSTYSSGMKARLGFAISMLARPELLLIDEILGVGDAQFKVKSNNAITEWLRSDKTAVLVSHSVQTLKSLCDRLVWIENGITVMEAETEIVIERFEAYNNFITALAKERDLTEKQCRDSLSQDPLVVLDNLAQAMMKI